MEMVVTYDSVVDAPCALVEVGICNSNEFNAPCALAEVGICNSNGVVVT